MEYIIRPTYPDEYGLLNDFLYEAIFVPEGMEPPFAVKNRRTKKNKR
jgi:hypothetical protein